MRIVLSFDENERPEDDVTAAVCTLASFDWEKDDGIYLVERLETMMRRLSCLPGVKWDWESCRMLLPLPDPVTEEKAEAVIMEGGEEIFPIVFELRSKTRFGAQISEDITLLYFYPRGREKEIEDALLSRALKGEKHDAACF